jgi:hypothetical protein
MFVDSSWYDRRGSFATLGMLRCPTDLPNLTGTSPIFTYGNRGTTKRGVRAEEHGIIYSWGNTPQLVQGESGITKQSIGVQMSDGVPDLHISSRVYYGLHHPIQYNVKVKDIGQVLASHVPALIGNWKSEDDPDEGSVYSSLSSGNMRARLAQSTTEEEGDSGSEPDHDMQEDEYEDDNTEAEVMDTSSNNQISGPLNSSKIILLSAIHS